MKGQGAIMLSDDEEAALRRHLHEVSSVNSAEWRKYLAVELHAFIDYNVYNGAPGHGQSLYNEMGNPWLHSRVSQFVNDRTEF
jgi:hypothetical protein